MTAARLILFLCIGVMLTLRAIHEDENDLDERHRWAGSGTHAGEGGGQVTTLCLRWDLVHFSVADQMAASRSRSLIVAHYLEKRFHLSARNIGLVPLNATAPPSSGKDSWDGACMVLLAVAPRTK